jgi:hypothetical protein
LGKVLDTVTSKVFGILGTSIRALLAIVANRSANSKNDGAIMKTFGSRSFIRREIRVIISSMGMAVFPEWVQAQKIVSELAERLGSTLNKVSARSIRAQIRQTLQTLTIQDLKILSLVSRLFCQPTNIYGRLTKLARA